MLTAAAQTAVVLLLSGRLGYASAAAPSFDPPPLHYAQHVSFRGLNEAGKVAGFDVSGHAQSLPGVHDYLRLVPPTPLAHGALFSEHPLQSEEWIVEVAFKVHGPPSLGLTEASDTKSQKLHKGGRGLAFWYTKTSNPGPVTSSSNPKTKNQAPPPLVPEQPTDPTDNLVSLFGSRTTFDGLGIIFDTSPSSPVYRRSDPRHWDSTGLYGVSHIGVVSGIMDDGSRNWLEVEKKASGKDDEEEEAAYLDKAIGECEAAFRNAQGLLWARISFVNNTIRVDLDLAPHTTLSKAGRDYAHNCFYLEGVSLPKGSYVGLSGLASGSPEPDSIDIYAMDVFEVIKGELGEQQPITDTDEPAEDLTDEPLEGTVDDGVNTLASEIFVSQARMLEAIDALARKVEILTELVGSGGSDESTSSAPLASHLASINAQLTDISLHSRSSSNLNTPGDTPKEDNTADTFTHLVQLQDRMMVELKAFGRKLDTANSQSIASIATLSSRSTESLQLLRRVSNSLEESLSKRQFSIWVWFLGVGVSGVLAFLWRKSRRDDDPWKKVL